MARSIDLLLRHRVTEDRLLAMLNDTIAEGVESLDFPREGAAVFLLHVEHEAEFRQSVGLLWASDNLHLDEISLAGRLAEAFETDVLWEPQTLNLPNGYGWCLVTPDLQLHAVDTVDVDEGIALRHGAPRLPINR